LGEARTYAIRPYAGEVDRLGFGPTIGGPSAHEANFTLARGLWNTSNNLVLFQWHLFGWPLGFALALAAIPFVLGRARKWDVVFLLAALFVVASYVHYFASGKWYGYPRYYVMVVPSLALLSARGIEELVRLPLALWGKSLLRLPPNRGPAVVFPAVLLAALWGYELTAYLPPQATTFAQWNAHVQDAASVVQRAGVHHAVVFQVQKPGNEWWPYGGIFLQNAPDLQGDVVYARDEGCADAQLARLYPGRSFYRLQQNVLRIFTPEGCIASGDRTFDGGWPHN
jgi:hypothetical protein